MPENKSFTPEEVIERAGNVSSIKFNENGETFEKVSINFSSLEIKIMPKTFDSLRELKELSKKDSIEEAVEFLLNMGSLAFNKMKNQ